MRSIMIKKNTNHINWKEEQTNRNKGINTKIIIINKEENKWEKGRGRHLSCK